MAMLTNRKEEEGKVASASTSAPSPAPKVVSAETVALASELVGFLASRRDDVRKTAAEHILALTGSHDGASALLQVKNSRGETGIAMTALARLLGDVTEVSIPATKALVNLTSHADSETLKRICGINSMWMALIELCVTPRAVKGRDVALMVLANLTTCKEGAKRLIAGRLNDPQNGVLDVLRIASAFFDASALKGRADPHEHTASVLTNLTSTRKGRALILEKAEPTFFQNLLKELRSPNVVRRRGCSCAVRNCLFSIDHHDFFMTQDGVIEQLLRPLLGPEGLEDEEEDDLTPELVSILHSGNLEREPDDSVRRSIVDALLMLATTRKGRDKLKERNAYQVIKVYHTTEDNEETSDQVFKLVDMLLMDEDEHERDGVWDLKLRKEIMGAHANDDDDEDEEDDGAAAPVDSEDATYEDLAFSVE